MKKKTIIFLICYSLTSTISFTQEAHNAILKERNNKDFRDYENNASDSIKEFYRLNHTNQTLAFVIAQKAKYADLDKLSMGIWDAMDILDTIIDESDPDLSLPQSVHAFQTAEKLRADNQPDWLILTGLIHDLGKVLTLFGEPQWAVVGDTFPVGCAYSEKVIFTPYFQDNPDTLNSLLQSKQGIYKPQCGLENVYMSWGHDEYLYMVMKDYLPEQALYIIRYHSFYAAHKEDEYTHLMNDYDQSMLPWLKLFSQYDLYSKSSEQINRAEFLPYYQELVAQYFPEKLNW
jgi:inositol oxygenase